MNRALRRTLLPLACLLLLWGGQLWADVYQYRDRNGGILLTDKPVRGLKLLKRYRFKTHRSRRGADSLAALRRRQAKLRPLINAAAREAALPEALVHAVIRVESAYRTDAVSPKGARGLMQLMPATARRFGVTDVHDPRQNLRGGTRYLRELMALFDNDLRLALAAYNAGENAVLNNGRRIPPYPETRRYVEKVLNFYREYRAGNQLAQR